LEEGGREGASVRMAKVRERSSRGGEEEDEEVYGGEREREREIGFIDNQEKTEGR